MSRYDGPDNYVYPGTEVLRNKADILDQAALDAFEADATALRRPIYQAMIASFYGDEQPLAELLSDITAIIE